MKILILVASPKEIEGFDLAKRGVKVVFTGIGKLNAFLNTRAVLQKDHFDKIINIGTCGSDKYQIGTILHPSIIKQGDAFALHDFPCPTFEVSGDKNVSILTGDNFINKQPNEEGSLVLPEKMENFDAYDMEAYAIALAAAFAPQNLHFIKIVSDNLISSVSEWEVSAKNLSAKLAFETERFIQENFISNYSII